MVNSNSLRLITNSVFLCLATACTPTEDNSQESAGIGISMPRVISEARGLDLDNIYAEIAIGNSNPVRMNQSGTTWTATLSAPPNTSQLITLTWLTVHVDQELTLAQIQESVNVGPAGIGLDIDVSANYIIDFDFDNDEINNLTELENNTDPLISDNPLAGADLIIPSVAPFSAPSVNGLDAIYSPTSAHLVGEWASSAQQDTQNRPLAVDQLMVDVNNDQTNTNPFHRWAAVHDGTYLYVLVLVDDVAENHSDSSGLENDDSIELYLDGNNSKHSEYIDSDDIYIQIALHELNSTDPNTTAFGGGRYAKGFFSSPLPLSGLQFATGPESGPASIVNSAYRQDVYEVRINIASYGITIGEPFGIEIQINDDDDGQERDSKWGWIHPDLSEGGVVDNTWRNPSLMGTAILQP